MDDGLIRIQRAESDEEIAQVRVLFQEYALSLEFDLAFQQFDQELSSLPRAYAEPSGVILLASNGNNPAGCAALRQLTTDVCEMKRLYVRPTFRGCGAGKRLVEAILAEGRVRGYRRMRLDTVPGMEAAIALYRAAGFRLIEPYRHNPVPGALFMERDL